MSENKNTKKVIKTYFITNTFITSFPSDFINAKGEKYIEVRLCQATVDGYITGDLCLHADFIIRDNYCDSFVNICNVLNQSGRFDKYSYPIKAKKEFRVWFTDLKGNEVIPDAFILKLLLTYEE